MTMTTEVREITTQSQTRVTPITEADLAWWTDKLATLDWVYAVSYADGAPH
jgi:hypothetical protein